MPVSEIARRVAAALLVLEGASGTFVGLQLLMAMLGAGGDTTSGAVIAAGTAAYGLALLAAGVGLALRRRWGLVLGTIAIALGALGLVALLLFLRGDEILLGGLVLWALTLACLLLARRTVPG
jgi:hypothetical protein